MKKIGFVLRGTASVRSADREDEEAEEMRNMIYGAGSLGTILGALLAEQGVDVTLVSRNRDHVRALQEKGATVSGSMSKTVKVSACLPEEIEGTFDRIFIMTKQLDNPGIARFLKPHLAEGGVFCCLQNGIPELALKGVVEDGEILGGVIPWSATWKGPGESELTSPADSVRFVIGSPFAENADALARTAQVLAKAGKVEVDDDLLSMRWSKLLVNASISALASSMGQPCGGVTHDPAVQRLGLRVMKECIDVGRAQGVKFRSVNDYDIAGELYFTDEESLHAAQAKMPAAFDSIRGAVSSVLQDLRKGKATEVQAISGIVCRSGRALGIPTPFNDRVVSVIEAIGRGDLPCGPENLEAYRDLMDLSIF